MPQTWMDTVEELSNDALTVEAQTVQPPTDEVFLGDSLLPLQGVNSVKVSDVLVRAIRPVTGRREWNTPGFLIEKPLPEQFSMTILPIEGRDHINEQEYQALMETEADTNAQRLRTQLIAEIPARVRELAIANRRTLEEDRYNAMLSGVVRQRNPNNLQEEVVVEFPWRTERIENVATPWSDPSVNAYDELVAFVKEGLEQFGALDGLMCRQLLIDLVRADAPPPIVNGRQPYVAELEQMIRDEIGSDFRFINNRAWVGDVNNKRYLFPVAKAMLVPAGGRVGASLRAPVVRSIEANQTIGNDANGAPIVDVRGQGAYRETAQNGKLTTLEVQYNAAPRPDPNLIKVVTWS